ncbi:hypothetical protein [Staphylococcus hominis]|uniref:hypothetical protein n=1 Tax=Staphylococcus hominis TaxID=1290 RepID=UPI000B1FCED5|nr:hypothetical protein [Staphylococcus hominis]
MNQYNKTMQGKNGKKAKENLVAFKKEVEKQQKNSTSTSNRDACDVITVTGFAHTTATSVALGVSGPVGWGVAAGMGALYAGESIACNHA